MSYTPIFHGRVSANGERIEFADNERLLRRGLLRRLAGVDVDVTIKPHRNKRSDQQNRWHWGVALPVIASELGYDRHEHEDLHYELVNLCFGTKRDGRLGLDVPNVRSSDLTTAQFSEFMEWLVRWAAQEHGIRVPLPGEAEFDR